MQRPEPENTSKFKPFILAIRSRVRQTVTVTVAVPGRQCVDVSGFGYMADESETVFEYKCIRSDLLN